MIRLRALANTIVELDEPAARKTLAPLRGRPELLFTENETNAQRLYGVCEAARPM